MDQSRKQENALILSLSTDAKTYLSRLPADLWLMVLSHSLNASTSNGIVNLCLFDLPDALDTHQALQLMAKKKHYPYLILQHEYDYTAFTAIRAREQAFYTAAVTQLRDLHQAIYRNDVKAVTELLRLPQQPKALLELLTAQNIYGLSSFHLAAYLGHVDIYACLLDAFFMLPIELFPVEPYHINGRGHRNGHTIPAPLQSTAATARERSQSRPLFGQMGSPEFYAGLGGNKATIDWMCKYPSYARANPIGQIKRLLKNLATRSANDVEILLSEKRSLLVDFITGALASNNEHLAITLWQEHHEELLAEKNDSLVADMYSRIFLFSNATQTVFFAAVKETDPKFQHRCSRLNNLQLFSKMGNLAGVQICCDNIPILLPSVLENEHFQKAFTYPGSWPVYYFLISWLYTNAGKKEASQYLAKLIKQIDNSDTATIYAEELRKMGFLADGSWLHSFIELNRLDTTLRTIKKGEAEESAPRASQRFFRPAENVLQQSQLIASICSNIPEKHYWLLHKFVALVLANPDIYSITARKILLQNPQTRLAPLSETKIAIAQLIQNFDPEAAIRLYQEAKQIFSRNLPANQTKIDDIDELLRPLNPPAAAATLNAK